MKKYIGVKLIAAVSMTEEQWLGIEKTAPAIKESGPSEDGYLVQYADGYESWCPKSAFENSNIPLHADNGSISIEDVRAFIARWETSTIGDKTTLVRATLVNGFEIVESSACVSAVNYDQKMGEQICLQKIEDKIWHLLGFLLQSAVSGFSGQKI